MKIKLSLLLAVIFTIPVGAVEPLLPTEVGAPVTRLVEIFSQEQPSGHGTLTYKIGTDTQTITFGTTPQYARGIVFHSSALPTAFREEIKGLHILQFTLGTLRPKAADKIPQFGHISLITRKIPGQQTVFKATTPQGKRTVPEGLAVLLFTPPTASINRSDEDKLRDSYFAQSGVITVTPVGSPELVDTDADKGRLTFKAQTFRLDFNVMMATPFNTQLLDLRGQVDAPLYWPAGKTSEQFIANVAKDSLKSSPLPVQMPEGILHHKRDVAGSTKKDTRLTPKSK